MKVFQQLENIRKMGPKDALFVLCAIFFQSEILVGVINCIFWKKSDSKWLIFAQISQQRHSNNKYKHIMALDDILSQHLGKIQSSQFLGLTESKKMSNSTTLSSLGTVFLVFF